MTKFFFFLIAATCIGLVAFAFVPPQSPFYPRGSTILGVATPSKSYQVIGFLPYWNLNKVTLDSLTHLTTLTYFALQLDSQGHLVTNINKRESEPGWNGFKKFTADPRFSSSSKTLSIQMLDNDAIDSLLAKSNSRQTAINTILDLINTYSLKGINIDFEPSGDISSSTRDNFTLFVKELKEQLPARQKNFLELSVDIYPTLINKQRLWDLESLSSYLSYFVVMGYDYHYRGSDNSGPVAPLRGATEFFNDDLVTNLGEISRHVPPSKIVLGIPFYGYRWATTTNEKYSATIGRGITASLDDVGSIIAASPESVRWDRDSFTPYIVLEQNNKISQIYFENDLSIGLKLDLVTSSNYQGIAIWALGYEGNTHSLWETIDKKLH